MGITGLIKLVEKAITPSSIDALRGSTVAIDSYYLLHKGSYCCAEKLVQGIKTSAMVSYALKYVKMLLQKNIQVIMVFDGRSLKAKALTEKKRRYDRDAAKIKATKLLREGKLEDARREFTKAVNITHDHALDLMEECRSIGVSCIVAMYEADAQLAYLNKIKLADYLISEDSDLILFGCTKIVYKLSLDGSCQIFDSSRLHLAFNKLPETFSFEKFRRICILSGCDYANSLPGVGLIKATKFFDLTKETDMQVALYKVPSYLNLKNANVTQDYIDSFLKAEATFKYMYVYDPIKREMVRLNEIENEDELKYCDNAGELLDKETAYQLALGNLNPKTLVKVNSYDPLVSAKRDRFCIWKTGSVQKTEARPSQQQQKFGLFYFKKVNTAIRPELDEVAREENKIESVEIDDLIMSYGGNDNSMTDANTSKRPYEIIKCDDDENVKIPSNNPFAKKRKSRENPTITKNEVADNLSLLKNLSTKESIEEVRVVSRFFKQQSSPIQMPNLAKRLEENKKFYEVTKGEPQESVSVEESSDEDIDVNEISVGSMFGKYEYKKGTKILSSKGKEEAIGTIDDSNDTKAASSKEENCDLNETFIESQENSTEELLVALIDNDSEDDSKGKEMLNNSYSVLSELKKKTTAIKAQSASQSTAKSNRKLPTKSSIKRKASSQPISDQSIQSKLSKFGFVKKESL